MAIFVYATANDFNAVLPSTAWGARTIADVNQALADASSEFDDHFRGRFPLPLASVDQSVARRCALYARYLFLGGRGFSPTSDGDRQVVADAMNVEAWLDKVQRRVLFPNVVSDPTAIVPTTLDPVGSAQPNVLSSSVVNNDGCRRATRCL